MRTTTVVRLVGVGLLVAAALSASQGQAQEAVRVYAAEGPAFAVVEAARAFEAESGVPVEVVSGPPSEWMGKAAGDADIVFASAEYMMTGFLKNEALHLDEKTLTPLYMRPSAILVRPGNPRNIKDFPDLLRAGIRVMVVDGSGQTGMWEDMAGREGKADTLSGFRKNIVRYAENSTEACQAWKDHSDIDAWVTWNIWNAPMRSAAEVVPVSPAYRVYRRSSAVLSARGAAKPSARSFLEFLVSQKGREIFRSWEWETGDVVDSNR